MVTNAMQERESWISNKPLELFKYVFFSEWAEAEDIVQQRQPGLIEALVATSLYNTCYDSDVTRTLFQLMVPLHFKTMVRQAERLLLVVDAHTASLPWEMLQADDEPLAVRIPIIRQLESTRFRKIITSTVQNTACVIGNPSTAGFYTHFKAAPPLLPGNGLPSLPGAAQEAKIIDEILSKPPHRYEVVSLYPRPEIEANHSAMEVFNALFKRPYRILAVAAHGVVEADHKDGEKRTGVVLSDGLLLTAAEIGQMEVMPELVFLNCCHLAVIETTSSPVAYNRLAYTLAQELIEMGVRCVVAAGWAVNDMAATTFAEAFFHAFVNDHQPFAIAVHNARRATYEREPASNTWGAYQAYGDPGYVLDDNRVKQDPAQTWKKVLPTELLEKLDKVKAYSRYHKHKSFSEIFADVQKLLQQSPPEWQKLSAVQFAVGRLYLSSHKFHASAKP